jgi:recombination protein RecR
MLPEPLTRLVEQLQRLPGIGAKGAQRLAFHVLTTPREDADRLCEAIRDVKERVTYCSVCNNITDTDPASTAPAPRATGASSAWWKSRRTSPSSRRRRASRGCITC